MRRSKRRSRASSETSWLAAPVDLGAGRGGAPPARSLGERDQPIEVAVRGRGGDALRLEAGPGAAVVEPYAHREVGEERLHPLQGAPAAGVAAPQEDGVAEAAHPVERSPTMMLGRKICTGRRSPAARTSCSASNFVRS